MTNVSDEIFASQTNCYAITKMKDMGGEITWLLALFNYDLNSINLLPHTLQSHGKLLQSSDSTCD